MYNHINTLLQELVTIRRHLHQNPEHGFAEYETAKYICNYLDTHQVPYQRIGETGVLACLDTGLPGQVIAFRADIDALPVHEENDVSYCSQKAGVMHACGHDSHTAVLMVTARFLKEHLNQFRGAFKFLFQPAEESPPGGALNLIEAGALADVDAIYGLHCDPEIPSNSISVIDGPMMAAADRFIITISGKGGHGAAPHQTTDAIILATQVVNSIQTIVSRNINPQHAVVLTVGKITGGSRFNVIAERVTLDGTVRTLLPEVRELVRRRLEEIVAGTVAAHGGEYQLEYEYGYPALINHKEHVDIVRQVGYNLLGENQVVEQLSASMVGEDFSYYLQRVPGAFFRMGTKQEGQLSYPLHSSHFDIDEKGMLTGVKMFVGLAAYHNKY